MATAGLAIAGVAAGVAASITAVAYSSASAIDRISELLDKTQSAGEKFTAMAYASNLAGVDAEGLAGSMVKLNKGLAEGDSGATGKALASIGLSADELRSKDPADAILEIADGLTGLKDRSSQTAAAMAIFGKSGANMLGFLLQGSEGIREAQEEAKKLGITVSTLEAAQVNDAFDGLSRVGSIFTGLGNQIAVAVAPHVIAMSESILDFAKNSIDVKSIVGTTFEFIKGWIITSAYAFQAFEVAGRLAFSGVMGLAAGVIKAFQGIAQVLAYIDPTGAMQGVADYLGESAQAAADTAKGSFEGIADASRGQQTADFFAGVENGAQDAASATQKQKDAMLELAEAQAKANDSATDLVDKLKEQNETFGMSSEEAAIYKMKQDGVNSSIIDEAKAQAAALDAKKKNKSAEDTIKKMEEETATFGMTSSQKEIVRMKEEGASPDQIARAEGASQKLSGLEAAKKSAEEQKKLMDDQKKKAEEVADSVKTPEEKMAEKLKELQSLKDQGLISDSQFNLASTKATEEFQGDKPLSSAFNGQSLGSSEALASIDRARGISNNSLQDISKNQLTVQKGIEAGILNLVSLVQKGGNASLISLDAA